MKSRYHYGALLLALGLAPQLWAQPAVPVVPVGPVVPAVPVVPVTPAGAAVAPRNMWSMLCMSPEQRALLRERCCRSALGQMLAGTAGPASMMTGGLLTNRCLLPTAAELAMPADGAQGAAAKIAQDEADAKARREAVRYLGTVDCHYWPEAQDALINSLRTDRNECVRFEAAMVLGRGCCCTPKTIAALSLTVSGGNSDGNPAETSERVRNAAAHALTHCSAVFHNISEPVPLKNDKEVLPDPGSKVQKPSDYYKKVAQMPREQILENARQALNQPNSRPRASEGIAGIVARAFTPKNNDRPEATNEASAPADLNAPLVQIPTVKINVQESPARYESPVAPQSPVVPQAPVVVPQAPVVPQSNVAPQTPGAPQLLPAPPSYEVPASQAAPASNDRRAPEGLLNMLGRRIRQPATPNQQAPLQPIGQEQIAPPPSLSIPSSRPSSR